MINDLKNSTYFSTIELQRYYDQWVGLTAEDQQEFILERLNLVQQCCGIHYDVSQEMKTSGSSSGLIRKYRWGPCFNEFFLFHYRLCFGKIPNDGLVYINVNRTEYGESKVFKYGDKNLLNISTGVPDDNLEKILTKIKKEFKKPIIWLMPTQLEIMYKLNEKLFRSLLEDYETFHCTGEICSEELKSFFKEKGKLLLDTMRIWNGGASFYTCNFGGLHWNNMMSLIEIKNNKLITSDFWNCAQLFLHYDTGDRLHIHNDGICQCGLPKQRNEWFDRLQTLRCINGVVEYKTLRSAFIEIAAEQLNCSAKEINNQLLGVNFGIHKKFLKVFYEFKDNIKIVNQSKNALTELTGCNIIFQSGGLKYGMFKNQRIFQIKEELFL